MDDLVLTNMRQGNHYLFGIELDLINRESNSTTKLLNSFAQIAIHHFENQTKMSSVFEIIQQLNHMLVLIGILNNFGTF